MSKNICLITLIQLLMWTLFSFCDYIDETKRSDIAMIFAIIFPIFLAVIYLIFENKLCNNHVFSKVKNTIFFIGIWCIETVLVGIAIWKMIDLDIWIIHQPTGGWENFLNGIEYPIMGITAIAIPIILIVIWKVVSYIYNSIKRKQ